MSTSRHMLGYRLCRDLENVLFALGYPTIKESWRWGEGYRAAQREGNADVDRRLFGDKDGVLFDGPLPEPPAIVVPAPAPAARGAAA
jgi:hypothetical protein